jgi:hypothetical protein
MTKIVFKSEPGQNADVYKTALAALLYPAVFAYHESRGVIYVAESHLEATVSRLEEAGVPIEVLKV